MTSVSLYKRMLDFGTLAEAANHVPKAEFALPSTINWMRGLAILVDEFGPLFEQSQVAYKSVQAGNLDERTANTVFEQLLFSINQIAALRAMLGAANAADVARMGIMAWYYGVYGAASAMIAAADGSFPDNHTATARHWLELFPKKKMVVLPFSDHITTLVKSDVDSALAIVRERGKHSLTVEPVSVGQAHGVCAEYLSGTATWEQDRIKENLIGSREFKELGVTDFRTKAARDLRDDRFRKRGVGFLHQASRYRGKANYRDAIYLAYGATTAGKLGGFISDLDTVLSGFSSMSAAFCSRRVGKNSWSWFVEDLETRKATTIGPKEAWKL